MKTKLMGAMALGLMVAACGTNPQERVGGGAAAGAATGAGVGALGGPVGVLAGAGIGAAAGAVTGATTRPDQVNLGRPLWNDPEVRVPGTGATRDAGGRSGGGMASGDTRQLQQALRNAGYDPGPIDGVYGPRTREAVSDWQRANNREATGRPDGQMRTALGLSAAPAGVAGGRAGRDGAYMGGGMVVDQQTRPGGTTTTPQGMPQGTPQGGTGAGAVPGGSMGGGGLSRPDTSTGGGGTMRAPSNNPMNDPIGNATPPGLNQNRDGGGQGGGTGSPN